MAAAAIVRRWHHGRFRSTATARARELLTELMPGSLKALGATASPDQALLNSTLFLGNLPAGIQLFSLFKANPALLDLVAAIMGSAWARRAPCATRDPARLGAVACLYAALLPAADMKADLAQRSPRSSTSRTSSTSPGAGPTTDASRSACSSFKAIVRPSAAEAYADIAAATIVSAALCERVERRFAEQHGGLPASASRCSGCWG